MTSSFSVGIDLGTTHCVLASQVQHEASAGDHDDARGTVQSSDRSPAVKPIEQLAQPGQVEAFASLPSFLYMPRGEEVAALDVPPHHDPAGGVPGFYARGQAAENPQRVVVAAKSWLCLQGAGRTGAILPWQSPTEVPKISAVGATQRYLRHLVDDWNASHPDQPLADQDVTVTVPASFDPASRDLTRQAALEAGLPESFLLLEEPQAAVYRWLAAAGDGWRRRVSPGDRLLVVDVGGGTCDLTLIAIDESDGELNLQRLAVGRHLLVGGDNMDLAIAHFASQRFKEMGHDLNPWQSVSLWHACRAAKERLLADDAPEEQTVSVLGRGSSLLASTLTTTLTKTEIADLVLEGFFPKCSADARPVRQPQSGFQDIGLPYEQDPAITKHVAAFLSDLAGADGRPTHLLLNGGVFASPAIRQRVIETIGGWCDDEVELLGGTENLDNAVAIGAAFYGWSKRNGGIRIRGGTARSYYVGIETAGLAIPGVPRPMRALCVAPQGMEEGTEVSVPSQEVGIVVGTPARFRFFSSTNRPEDAVGHQVDQWAEDELVESEPIELNLTSGQGGDEPFVPVRFESRVTELGMFELWCHATQSDDAWKMEFNAREET